METQVFYFFLTLSFLLIAIITTYLYSYLFHHHHHHKSPTYTFISFFNNRHRLLSWYTDVLSQSPSQTVVIRRLTPPKTIITANPKNIEYMLKTHFINFPKGKPFTDVLQDFLGTGIFNVDGDLWHAQRKLASHQFTSRSLKQHVKTTLVEAVKTKLLPFLDSLAADSPAPAVDFQEVLRRLGFDIVCKLSLGFDPCCFKKDQHDQELPILKAFDTAAGISAKRAAMPIAAVWKLKRFFGIGSEKVLEDSLKVIHGYITEIVDERRKNISEKTELDLLSRMIITGGGVTEEQIRDMVISFIMAGRDTTSSAMTWLFYVVSRHAHVEERLVKEIRCKFKEEDDDELLCEKEKLKEMKYLQACICETMRLYPPVSWDSKHAVDDDVLPDGTPVGSGDRVTYFPYGMGRMERLWGVDRLEFRPDRWLAAGREMKEVSPYKYPVFHAGPRVCLGKGLANVQMSYVVASILNRFEIRPVRLEEEAVYLPLLTAHMEGGFKVHIRRRRRPPCTDPSLI